MVPLRKTADKVALVTGAGRGIGRAVAEAFVARGYAVALAEVRSGLGRAVERTLARAGHAALFCETDVADSRSVARCVRATLRRFGRLDCVVNNAGVLRIGALASLPVPALERMLAVNLRGPLLVSRAALPIMLEQEAGVIVNVASLLGKEGAGEYVTYCATKFGVVGLTEALADELTGTGVKVFALCPGLVDTAMARVTHFEGHPKLAPAEVAELVVALVTGRRRARSGAAIDISR